MRRLFVILATLSVLPLAAQNEDDARQFQNYILLTVYKRMI